MTATPAIVSVTYERPAHFEQPSGAEWHGIFKTDTPMPGGHPSGSAMLKRVDVSRPGGWQAFCWDRDTGEITVFATGHATREAALKAALPNIVRDWADHFARIAAEERDEEEAARRDEARTVRRETLADLGDNLLAALEALVIAYQHDAAPLREGEPTPTELVNARAVLAKASALGLLPIPPRPADPPPGAMRLLKRPKHGWSNEQELFATEDTIARIAARNGRMTPDQVREALAAGQTIHTVLNTYTRIDGAAP